MYVHMYIHAVSKLIFPRNKIHTGNINLGDPEMQVQATRTLDIKYLRRCPHRRTAFGANDLLRSSALRNVYDLST
jgi:hypothetical protein